MAVLERQDCKKLWEDYEYDFDNPSDIIDIGHSHEKSDEWFDDIQKKQGISNVRLGIFLNDGTVIGDIALQDIDRTNRVCSVGMGISRIQFRCRGYGQQAVKLMLSYGFDYLGMERITASTLEINAAGKKSLEKCGFVLEGTEREAVYLNGRRQNRLNYAVLRSEYI